MSSSVSKPVLGVTVGGVLGLLDGLSGYLEPSLASKMLQVVTFSAGKGLLCGLIIGWVSQKVHSMIIGIFAGVGIAAALSYLVVLHAGMALLWDILLPGMLLGAVVGFATQKFGRLAEAGVTSRQQV